MTLDKIKHELVIHYGELAGLDLSDKTNIPLSEFKDSPKQMDSLILLDSLFDMEDKYDVSLTNLQTREAAMLITIDQLAEFIFNEITLKNNSND